MTSNRTIKDLQKELSFFYRVARTVHSLEINEVLKEIVSIAVEVSKADACLIYVWDNESHELVLRASKNPHAKLLQIIKMKMGEGITGWVARERKPVIISEGAGKDPRFKFFPNLPEDRYEAFFSVPITNKDGTLGVINIQHRKRHKHTKMEIDLITAIGKLVGGALENALLVEQSSALKEALELRRLIDRAKGVLIKKKKLSEEEAHKFLQTQSMNLGKSLKEIAEAIILADKFQL